MTKKIRQRELPQQVRDKVLIGFLHQKRWNDPSFPHFRNLQMMGEFLESVADCVEQGDVLVLNLVFQNLVSEEWKRSENDSRIEEEDQLHEKTVKVKLIRRQFCCLGIEAFLNINKYLSACRKCWPRLISNCLKG